MFFNIYQYFVSLLKCNLLRTNSFELKNFIIFFYLPIFHSHLKAP